LARVAATLSKVSDSCLLLLFYSNSSFIMFTLVYENDVDYFFVEELLNIIVD
jgi:hypothetical protein